jgi:hypothetical protein
MGPLLLHSYFYLCNAMHYLYLKHGFFSRKFYLFLFLLFFTQKTMKLNTSLLGISSSVLLLLTSAVVGSTPSSDESIFELVQNFRESKNIMFSCMYGGSSHVVWVLSILEELSNRGHSTFFITRVCLLNDNS